MIMNSNDWSNVLKWFIVCMLFNFSIFVIMNRLVIRDNISFMFNSIDDVSVKDKLNQYNKLKSDIDSLKNVQDSLTNKNKLLRDEINSFYGKLEVLHKSNK